MELTFRKSSSNIRPELVDETSSPKVTYVRRNIVEKTVEANEEMGTEAGTYYEYEEAKLTKEEYQLYLQSQEQLQLRADVDYVILMGGY